MFTDPLYRGSETCQFSNLRSLLRRQTGDETLDKFLGLVQSSFRQKFSTDTFIASLGSSLGISFLIFLAWCLVRPYHSVIYAPKLRHSSSKLSAPPHLGKGYFSWIKPLIKCHEEDLLNMGLGLDAIVFLKFMRFCRTLFMWIGLLGLLVMVPVNVTCNVKGSGWVPKNDKQWFTMLAPYYSWAECMWAHVVIAWAFNAVILWLLWRDYRSYVSLRRRYFESPEYMASLHSRTLMIWDVPKSAQSDQGLNQLLIATKAPLHGDEKYAIGRDVKVLPELLEAHSRSVRALEKVLAKYLRNPNALPSVRPTCKPNKDDKSMPKDVRVDAIEYHKNRCDELERQIWETRRSIDRRDPTQYGFVSFPTVSRAHIAAKQAKGKHPKGANIRLATRPNDIIWENFGRGKASRRWNGFIGNLLFTALSLLWVIPNALIAVFLSNLNNIAVVWPAFTPHLAKHNEGYALVQGFAAPTVTSLVYLMLPIIMRRLSKWQGDITRSQRERHVVSKLYVFFVINNLIIFTIFGTLWTIIQGIVDAPPELRNFREAWAYIRGMGLGGKFAVAIFDVSTFWITYLLQRNLGAMLDLIQILPLIWKSFASHFLSPTTRERIEWTAPPYFDYATYYNYFLFYLTIALCFSTIQPLVLPVVWLYFFIDSFMKKYALMYVFLTKVESGGTFWRIVFNRILFATALFNCVVGLVVWARFKGSAAACVLPLIVILIAFKLYCRHTFDPECRYYTRGSDRDSALGPEAFASRKETLDKRYSHPALHRKLLVPMVPGKAEHLLNQLFASDKSLWTGSAESRNSSFIDLQDMSHRSNAKPGKKSKSKKNQGFEVVQESDMDFANFMHRAEFGDHGGSSGTPGGSTRTSTIMGFGAGDADSIRSGGAMSPGLPPVGGYAQGYGSRPGTPLGASSRSGSPARMMTPGGRAVSPSPLSLGAGGGGGYSQVPLHGAGGDLGYRTPMGTPYADDTTSGRSGYIGGYGLAPVGRMVDDGVSETEVRLLGDAGPAGGERGRSPARSPRNEYRGVQR